MTTGDQTQLKERIRALTGWDQVDRVAVITDTSDCMRIQRGNVVRVGGRDFIIKGNRYETRFGIEYQPKYWVFSAVDLDSAEPKILKTEFHEDFHVHIGLLRIHCYRSPEKETQVLQLVRGDSRFMQGQTVFDDKNKNVRILDYIKGPTIFQRVHLIQKSHEQYFYEDLPDILCRLVKSLKAIAFLHEQGTCHGDIRNDHIIIDNDTGHYRWIDFDLNQHVADFDVWSLGNIIGYAVAKGICSFQSVMRDAQWSDEVKAGLTQADASAFYEYRIINLRKLYPYIPPGLNDILMHFSLQTTNPYTNCDDLINDFEEMLEKEFDKC